VNAIERRLDDLGLLLMSPWTRVVAELAFGGVVVCASMALTPTDEGVAFLGAPLPAVCGYRLRTGLPCPLCGATRAFVHLVRGHVVTAWHHNPAASVLFIGIVGTAVVAALRVVRRDPAFLRPHPALVALAGLAWLAFLYGCWRF
jgi:hypothetical protein